MTQKTFGRFLIIAASQLVLIPAAAAADANSGSSPAAETGGLHYLDWGLIVLYAVSTIALGVYFGRRQRSTNEYFVGSGKMNPFFIGVSLFATLLSTISYLSVPGEVAGKGPVVIIGVLGWPITYFVVAYGLIPVLMRRRVTSAYELLEENLGISIRLFGALMFLTLRLVWMALLVYLAAKALTVMMDVDMKYIPLVVLITGLVAVIYTSVGGLQAVVITDFMQTCLLFGGALMVILTVSWHWGGFGWFPTEWHANWDRQPIFSFDPKTRITVVGIIVSNTIWNICTAGGDQTSIQRFMATHDIRAARRALATQALVGIAVMITLTVVGIALLAYFEANMHELPAGVDLKENADDHFPRYISNHLPIGLSGLVVAAMFAAAMSSIDSGVNSVTAVVMTDFLARFGLKPKTDKGNVIVARLLALGIGATVVLGSTYMEYIPGNITAVTSKTVNLLTTPIFSLFFFALFVRWASTPGVWIGTLAGVMTAAGIAFSGPLVYLLHRVFDLDPSLFNVALITKTDPVSGNEWTTCEDPISFLWIAPISLAVNLLAGMGASLLFPKRP